MKDSNLQLSQRLALACLLTLAGPLWADDMEDSAPAADVPTLERVQALLPDEELDLYRFDNPVLVEPNRFAEAYDTGPTPEEVALSHGGYINYGINLGLQESWNAIKKLTGMRPDVQAAVARPPPLDEEQMRRAARLCGDGSGCAQTQ